MEWVETTGRTVADALDAALDQLGVLEQEAEYEVLEEPKTGLFGRFGGSEARLRVRVKPISREKPGDRSGRRGRARKGGGGDGSSRDRARTNRGRAGSGSGAGSGQRAPARRSRGRAREANDGRSAEFPRRRDEGVTMEDQVEVSVEEQTAAAEAFMRGLVEAFGFDAEVRSRIDDEVLLVEVSGAHLGLLVGPGGATLHAIEELVRTVVQRQTGGHGMRLHVDVGGYRAKRREALAAFTRQLVERVLESGREQVLDPMPPPDRKVVHDTAAEIGGVETLSEGEEPRRRVVIRRV